MWKPIFLLTFILKSIAIFSNPFAYVANSTDGTVSVIDILRNTVSTTVSVGSQPRGVAITPDATFAYVTNFGDDTVSVIDISTNTISTTFAVGTNPTAVAITPYGAFAYVADSNVTVIDTSANTVSTTVPVGAGSAGVAITPDGAFAYVTNSSGNNVNVIDISTNTVSTMVFVGVGPEGIDIIDIMPPLLNITGDSKKNNFLTEGDRFNRISWSLPEGIIPPIQYQIFRDSQWIATISGNKQSFKDHNLKKKNYSYRVVAEDEFGSVAAGTVIIQSK